MSNIFRKFKKSLNENNYKMTDEELQEINRRILELKDEAIICCSNKDFNRLNEIALELKEHKKRLKLAQKNAK